MEKEPMESILILNALMVNEGVRKPADIFIKNGRIETIGGSLSGKRADTVIDAGGSLLLPGMIDCHVHCREPGLTHKGDLHTETRAAVAGGITSIMEMPNTRPPTVTHALLEEKFAIAAEKSMINYSFYLGATNSNLDELKAIDPRNVCGVKLFMGSSTGNMLVDHFQTLEKIFAAVPIPVSVHCEDTANIRRNEQAAREKFGDNIPFSEHWKIRSEEACWKSTALAVKLAAQSDVRLHVLHLTTAKELELFEAGPAESKKITAEVCPHHLWFSEADYKNKGALIKCNPAIKTAADRAALRQALCDGIIDTVGTDHAPHLLAEKQKPYTSCPSGMPSIQSAISVLLEFLPPETVAEKTAHNPARIFQCQERGFIREGYWADLALIDTQTPTMVTKENIKYKCGWSPFEGITFKSSITATIVSGRIAYRDGQLNETIRGQRLVFDR